jgi:predicted nucleotidyltransferase
LASYREIYIAKQVEALRGNPKILALWEGGSAATGSTDQYSDIDLFALCACGTDEAFELMESAMPTITHRYIEPVGRDLKHRIYFHDGAPKHFCADVGVISKDSRETLRERMVIERHGNPIVFFDRKGLIKPHPVDKVEWRAKLERRIRDLEDTLPIYTLQVLKPLDRHHYAEAFAFYYHGLLRRFVELLGIRFRPYRYDFELRYLERDFPQKEQASIHEYMKYVDPDDLRRKVALIDQEFKENLAVLKEQGIRLP